MAGPVLITVLNGSIHSRHYTVSGGVVPPSFANSFPDVPGLFQLVEDVLRQKPHSLVVRYDPAHGYPAFISVDFDRMVADDEFAYTVVELRSLVTLD